MFDALTQPITTFKKKEIKGYGRSSQQARLYCSSVAVYTVLTRAKVEHIIPVLKPLPWLPVCQKIDLNIIEIMSVKH